MLTPGCLFFFSLGPIEMVILLIIVLILFGGFRLPILMRSLSHGIHNFKGGMRQDADEAWQFSDGRQRQLNEPPKTEADQRWAVWLVFGGAAFLLIAAGVKEAISTKQLLVALGVLIVWVVVWRICIGRSRDR